MSRSVFLSYSHKDEKWRERVLAPLQALSLQTSSLDTWVDTRIEPGADWHAEIVAALNRAGAAVLLISNNFLASPFIKREEVARVLERRTNEGLPIYAVLVEPCPWKKVPWLARIQLIPHNGKSLAELTKAARQNKLARLAERIDDTLTLGRARDSKAPRQDMASGTSSETPTTLARRTQELGDWIRRRGNRADLMIHAKGAHTEGRRQRVTPTDIRCDINETLTCLAVQTVDVFTLHRDDAARPVGPLLECLAEARDAGHLRCYGASNWSRGRLEEADDYADSRGLARFALSSPQFSLAVPNEPSWPGCLDARDAQSRRWYERTQRPLFAWSALALGFFTGRYEPRESLDPAQVAALEADPWTRDVLRVFYSADNFRRRSRAEELAVERGVSATQIALAWVLHQPLALFAVVGPRSVPELEELFAVFDISLTPTELAWLDLGAVRE